MDVRKLSLGLVLLLLVTIILSLPESSSGQTSRQIVRNNNVGVALMEQLKFAEAAAEFDKVVQAAPEFVPGYVNLGIARFYELKYEEATQALERAFAMDPKQLQARYMLGLVYQNQDRVEEALNQFQAVHQADPTDPYTNYYLGTLYNRERDYEKAAVHLLKAIEKQPYNASAHYSLSRAYLRSGKRDEGMKELEVFQKLGELFGSTTVGHQYLEQGRYAEVIDQLSGYLPGSAERWRPAKVKFLNVAAEAGLNFKHDGPGSAATGQLSGPPKQWASFVGSGLSFGDLDSDGRLDLVIANSAPDGARSRLYKNLGQGRFQDVTESAGLTFQGQTMAALWGDVDQDGDADLYLVNRGPNLLYRNDAGRLTDITAASGVGDGAWGVGGAFVDYDHDGDLDLLVANLASSTATGRGSFPANLTGAPNVLYQNDGTGNFKDVSESSGLSGGSQATVALMATDFDNSRDIDFHVSNLNSPNQLFSNLRDGTFREITADVSAAVARSHGLAVGDYNQDGWMDLLLAGSPTRLLTNQLGARFGMKSLQPAAGPATGVTTSIFLDFDNDGDHDLLIAGNGPFASGRALTLLENNAGNFTDVTAEVGLDGFASHPIRGVSVADYDDDGDLDIAASVNGAPPLLLRNDGGNQNNWLQVQLTGTNSNRAGLGTKVEILAGTHWLKQEISGGNGFLSQSPPIAHFGLGQNRSVDVVRLLWPGGVLQSEVDPKIGTRLQLTELDRKGTSCPILYVWNGEHYSFQTDFLGGSAFGYLLSPGQYNFPDTDEYIKLNPDQMKLKDGKVAITLNNQLEEVIFFDQLELVVVDHPNQVQIYPDEKLLPGPPFDDFRLLAFAEAWPPVAARDSQGHDLLKSILHIDRNYADLVRPLPYKGYAEESALVLDLGDVDPARAMLLMHAWIDYADSTSNLAAAQAGLTLTPPYLQVRDTRGQWVTAIERMGFPAGLPKPMTVDLSGKFLSDSREIRIVTNMRIHWDQILVANRVENGMDVHRLTAHHADLHFGGFPRFYSPDGKLPKVYDYRNASPTAPWKVHIGGYTRYGDVRPLLTQRDDMYVITRSGDEIEAYFDLTALPRLAEGWTRDYLVYVDGFGKDMDVNSAAPDFVGPLPYHAMPSYPYPADAGYPMDEAHQKYLSEWNTRRVSHWTAPRPQVETLPEP